MPVILDNGKRVVFTEERHLKEVPHFLEHEVKEFQDKMNHIRNATDIENIKRQMGNVRNNR